VEGRIDGTCAQQTLCVLYSDFIGVVGEETAFFKMKAEETPFSFQLLLNYPYGFKLISFDGNSKIIF
jgi:hypothetical protein